MRINGVPATPGLRGWLLLRGVAVSNGGNRGGYGMKEQDFLKHYIQNARHLMWFLGAGTSRSAGLPTANDIIWDLKVKYYCAEENQDIKAHDINNKAIKSKIQVFLDSRKFPAVGSPQEYSFY